jgi:PPOX class probable FMN-dependent enzyme
MDQGTDHRIRTVDQLRAVVGDHVPGIDLKVYDHLNDHARDYISRSPFLVLSTSGRDGRQDASPKGDEPGFVEVEDDRTILVPDRPGNKLVYGLVNIIENPHVGLLFMIPGTNETLRVNGSAELIDDPAVAARLAARDKPAVLAIRVHVEECFFHCAKAFLRSKLWKPETWSERKKISFGKMFAERLELDDASLAADIDARVEADYEVNL